MEKFHSTHMKSRNQKCIHTTQIVADMHMPMLLVFDGDSSVGARHGVAVVDIMASGAGAGAVHHTHFLANWLQEKDRGLLLPFPASYLSKEILCNNPSIVVYHKLNVLDPFVSNTIKRQLLMFPLVL
ncbi:hypothetical protein L6164_022146 [Bauhinia variegata]|uniref:Uncharacterized protein n=1 Tax=Bauhinia variegata TaxID=167791 RepID=A0ACB9MEA0_BAUVA|nr:hypothetical protein L6164_022146 [Bauhinia variegata]